MCTTDDVKDMNPSVSQVIHHKTSLNEIMVCLGPHSSGMQFSFIYIYIYILLLSEPQ